MPLDLIPIRWQSATDFAVLVVAIYFLLRWSLHARALRIALLILCLRIGGLFATQLDLVITTWVLDALTILALLVLVVGFQPELRRLVMQLDLPWRPRQEGQLPVLAAIAGAGSALAQAKCGALIVVVQNDSIDELITGGVAMAARVSPELIQAIFQKGSPVHDGALIIEGDQITHAGAILPLTQRPAPDPYGTRHRAGIGLTERSDALVLVVSEERGEATVIREGQTRPVHDADELLATLRTMTTTESVRKRRTRPGIRGRELGLAASAIALSTIVWSATFLLPGKSVRVQTVPVEFTNVPPGLTVGSQSTDSLQVWLRATDFIFDSVSLGGLVIHCDLKGSHPGVNVIRVDEAAFQPPPGIRVEGMAPRQITVRLASASSF